MVNDHSFNKLVEKCSYNLSSTVDAGINEKCVRLLNWLGKFYKNLFHRTFSGCFENVLLSFDDIAKNA